IQKHIESIQNQLKTSGVNKKEKTTPSSLVEVLRSERVSVSEEFVEGLQKYYCYVECLQLDNEKFARGRDAELSSFNFDQAESRWYNNKEWPSYAVQFIPWADRQTPPARSSEEVKKTIDNAKGKPDQILVSIQLVLNYWDDAYKFCKELQDDPQFHEM